MLWQRIILRSTHDGTYQSTLSLLLEKIERDGGLLSSYIIAEGGSELSLYIISHSTLVGSSVCTAAEVGSAEDESIPLILLLGRIERGDGLSRDKLNISSTAEDKSIALNDYIGDSNSGTFVGWNIYVSGN